jgi:hypothetical protein
MTDQPDDGPPHITIEFVGGPFCGEVVNSRTKPLRTVVLRRLLSAARSDRPAELLMRPGCPRLTRVKVRRDRETATAMGREKHHRYRLLVELRFASRVLFRAEYVGAVMA